MADTGAPYFIPYIEPTDLVRDYPAADEASADAIAAALDAIPVLAGIGSNAVTSVKSNTQVQSLNSAALMTVTGLSAAITPSSSNSRILVLLTLNVNWNGGAGGGIDILRNGVVVRPGDASGSRSTMTAANRSAITREQFVASVSVIDEPGTTATRTYTVRVRNLENAARVCHINRPELDVNENFVARTSSSLTVIEVAS